MRERRAPEPGDERVHRARHQGAGELEIGRPLGVGRQEERDGAREALHAQLRSHRDLRVRELVELGGRRGGPSERRGDGGREGRQDGPVGRRLGLEPDRPRLEALEVAEDRVAQQPHVTRTRARSVGRAVDLALHAREIHAVRDAKHPGARRSDPPARPVLAHDRERGARRVGRLAGNLADVAVVGLLRVAHRHGARDHERERRRGRLRQRDRHRDAGVAGPLEPRAIEDRLARGSRRSRDRDEQRGPGASHRVLGGSAAHARPSTILPASMSRVTFQASRSISATFALASQET